MSSNVFEFPSRESEPGPVSKDVDESLRADFEEWCAKVGYDVERFPVDQDQYLFADTQWAWVGWCGASMHGHDKELSDSKNAKRAIEEVLAEVRKTAFMEGRRAGLMEAESKNDLFAVSPPLGACENLREVLANARADGAEAAPWFHEINAHLEAMGRRLERYQALCDQVLACVDEQHLPKTYRAVLTKAANGESFVVVERSTDDE